MRIYAIALVVMFGVSGVGAGTASAAERAADGVRLSSPEILDLERPTPSGPGGDVVLPANPLWAMRLSDLPATLDRPIFSPSRRPRAPPPVLLAAPPPPMPVAAPREPDRPALALVGTIVGETFQIAIFRDEATKETTRLRTGDNYKGWALRSVTAREALFEGPHQNAVLALPVPEAAAAIPILAGESEPARHRKR